MSASQNTVDAHLMLVQNLAHVVAQELPWQSAYDAVEASARALAAIPAQPRCDGCGKTIAEHNRMLQCPPAQDAQGVPVAYAVMLPSGRISRTRNTAERAQRHVDDWNARYPKPPHAYVAPLGVIAALRASSPADTRNAPLYDPADVAFPKRPPYCGSGHCSCIECHFPVTKEST